MRISRPRVGSLAVAIMLASATFGMSLGWQVPGVAAGAANTVANEAVRLINETRAATGRPRLVVDSLLSSLARDGAIPCPDTTTRAISGRAKDFALYGSMSHDLRNCLTSGLSGTTFVSVMQHTFGFGSVGEIIGMNSGWGTGQIPYVYQTLSTTSYSTTSHIVTAWMGSRSHANIILGSYNRIGCGTYTSGSTYYYDCLFSVGTGHAWSRPAATRAPTKAPSATLYTSPGPSPSVSGSWASPTVTPEASVTLDAGPSEEVAGMVATNAGPTLDPAAAARLESGSGEGDNATRDLAVRGGILAGAALALFVAAGLMLRLFRRGRGGTIA